MQPKELPSQSTMSRRLQTTEVQVVLATMERRLAPPHNLIRVIDGKPLVVGTHSKDSEATWGRAGRGFAKGYKLHAVYGSSVLPETWAVASLNVSEQEVGARLISLLKRVEYILGDKAFDSNPLHDLAHSVGCQLVAER